jgi:predicted SAM-dependent methyltransferase
MKINLGCSDRPIPGYVNIDIKNPKADVLADIRHLPYEDGSIDEIYASHVLEHFGRYEFMDVLREWRRVIKPGSFIYIAVPDIESSIKYYNKTGNLHALYGQFWGGQRDEYDHHKFGYTFDTLSEYLKQVGFINPMRYDTFKYLPPDFDDYSKSFLPHMDFNGHHLSLNICAQAPSDIS